jgi:hypothetical protein
VNFNLNNKQIDVKYSTGIKYFYRGNVKIVDLEMILGLAAYFKISTANLDNFWPGPYPTFSNRVPILKRHL